MKKLLSLVLALAMLLTVGSFAMGESESFDVTIWVAEEIVDLTKQQVADFNASNEFGITINAEVVGVSEADAATNMLLDVEAGADMFCFAQDQFARLVQARALSEITDESADFVVNNNAAGVVAAATSGDAIYAYPLTADNGYFMYYDKRVIPEEDVDSLEAIIADCEAAGKYFAFEMNSSAWYAASFFFGTGCVSEWETDSDGNFISVYDTFNSPQGLIAVKGMKKLVDSPMHLNSSSGSSFDSNSAVVVTGTWDYVTVQGILGDNMGVADLPSFDVDGIKYHLGSFNGCKLMGIRPTRDAVKLMAMNILAEYLTGYKCQMERFEARSWGPSNLEAQASDEVQQNPGLAALLAQSPYSLPQGQIHGSWWDIAKVIADDVKAATDEAGLQTALDNYLDRISALFTLSDDVKNGWTVIGTYNSTDGFFYTDYQNETRSNWGEDVPMTLFADGLWKTAPYAMEKGVEFKVRQGLSWDNNFPADNFVVPEAGTYIVVFDPVSCEVSLQAAE
ncbi:MAG: extracellular solute-binding protein [Clostridia bacterium]|nr:extracellular solute-binding protein [Clostridia bacterium]